MFQIEITVDKTIGQFNLSKEEIDELKKGILANLLDYCYNSIHESSNELGKTRGTYQDAIRFEKTGEYSEMIFLDPNNKLANMVEQGISGFDLKDGFFKSDKAKTGKNGQKYLTIPFHIGTPDSSPTNPAFSQIMPENLYKAAKKLKPGEQIDIKNLPKELQEINPRVKIVVSNGQLFAYERKSPTFAGLTRGSEEKGYGGFMTFRRVSETASGPNSWIHPGIEARNFFEVAQGQLEDNLDKITEDHIKEFLFETFGEA
jgi:hypothetical protein